MTPLPKRRHSTRRQGKREQAALTAKLMVSYKCSKCGTNKLSHHVCPKCGFYK